MKVVGLFGSRVALILRENVDKKITFLAFPSQQMAEKRGRDVGLGFIDVISIFI